MLCRTFRLFYGVASGSGGESWQVRVGGVDVVTNL